MLIDPLLPPRALNLISDVCAHTVPSNNSTRTIFGNKEGETRKLIMSRSDWRGKRCQKVYVYARKGIIESVSLIASFRPR